MICIHHVSLVPWPLLITTSKRHLAAFFCPRSYMHCRKHAVLGGQMLITNQRRCWVGIWARCKTYRRIRAATQIPTPFRATCKTRFKIFKIKQDDTSEHVGPLVVTWKGFRPVEFLWGCCHLWRTYSSQRDVQSVELVVVLARRTFGRDMLWYGVIARLGKHIRMSISFHSQLHSMRSCCTVWRPVIECGLHNGTLNSFWTNTFQELRIVDLQRCAWLRLVLSKDLREPPIRQSCLKHFWSPCPGCIASRPGDKASNVRTDTVISSLCRDWCNGREAMNRDYSHLMSSRFVMIWKLFTSIIGNS